MICPFAVTCVPPVNITQLQAKWNAYFVSLGGIVPRQWSMPCHPSFTLDPPRMSMPESVISAQRVSFKINQTRVGVSHAQLECHRLKRVKRRAIPALLENTVVRWMLLTKLVLIAVLARIPIFRAPVLVLIASLVSRKF